MVTHTCGLCSKVFRKKWNLVVHMKNVHDINIDEKLINCAACGYKTRDRLKFRRHMNRHHPDRPMDRSAFEMIDSHNHKLIECKLCNHVLRYQNMKMHRARVHNIVDEPNTEYDGNMCEDPITSQQRLRSLLENKDLGYESVSKSLVPGEESGVEQNANQQSTQAEQMETHEESTDTEEETNEAGIVKKHFKCSMCPRTFKNIKTLKNHLHVEHSALDKQDHKKTCPICQHHPPGNTLFEMIQHFNDSHNINVELIKISFKSVSDFFAWKLKEEAETCSKFSGRRKFSLRDCITFKCNRSGFRVSKSQGKRKCHPNFSSIKINGFCPANIRATKTPDGAVVVQYLKTHVGHEKDFKTVYLTEAERLKLADNLASKSPGYQAWHDVRGPVYYDDLIQPACAAQEELKAARKEINVCLESKTYDVDAIAAWVKEKWTSGDYSLIYFKEPGTADELSQFHTDDFVLFFMTNYQKEEFQKYGNGVICFEGTNNVNNHNIQMYTLLVSDETYTGFPCVFMFSNRDDIYVFRFFFQKIKDCMGVLAPNVFLTDFTACYYDAWCSVMGVHSKRPLLSAWRVTEKWRSNLAENVKSREKRREFCKTLDNLLYTDNKENFKSLVEELYITCNLDPELTEFYNFFVDSYCTKLNIESWAHCYRVNSDFNCHMQVDSYRHILKLCRLFGSKAAMLDKTLVAILRFMGSKLTNMLVKMNQTKVLTKLHALKLHHRNCFRIDLSAVSKDGEEWNVSLPGKTELFHVKKIGKCCEQCSLPCTVCNSCYHEYSCNCWDYNHHGQMCEHIHLVCRAVNAEQSELARSTEVQMQIQNAPEEMEIEREESLIQDPLNFVEVKIIENEAENFAKTLKNTARQTLLRQLDKIITAHVKTHTDVLFVSKLLMGIGPGLNLLRKQSTIKRATIDQQVATVLKQTQPPKVIKEASLSNPPDLEEPSQAPDESAKIVLHHDPKYASMVHFIALKHSYAKPMPSAKPKDKAQDGLRIVKRKRQCKKIAQVVKNSIPVKFDAQMFEQLQPTVNKKPTDSNQETSTQVKLSCQSGSSIQTKTDPQPVKKTIIINSQKLAPKKVIQIKRKLQPVALLPKLNSKIVEKPNQPKPAGTAKNVKPLLVKILPKPEPGTAQEQMLAKAAKNAKPLLVTILTKPSPGATQEQILAETVQNSKSLPVKILLQPASEKSQGKTEKSQNPKPLQVQILPKHSPEILKEDNSATLLENSNGKVIRESPDMSLNFSPTTTMEVSTEDMSKLETGTKMMKLVHLQLDPEFKPNSIVMAETDTSENFEVLPSFKEET